MFGEQYVYVEISYYGIAASLAHSETSLLPPVVLVGHSFEALILTFSPGIHRLTESSFGFALSISQFPSSKKKKIGYDRGGSCSEGRQASRHFFHLDQTSCN